VLLNARRSAANLVMAAMAVVLVGTVAARVGQAGDLANTLDGQIRATKAAENPLIPLIVRAVSTSTSPLRPPAVRMAERLNLPGDERMRVFEVMNLVYAALLAWVLCALLDMYSASTMVKAVTVLNVFLTVPLARVPGYQPVDIDLGACLFVTFAIYVVIVGRRWAIVPATMLAVMAREVGVLVALFGLYRDWRLEVPRARSLATYLPALATFIALEMWAGTSGVVLFEKPRVFTDPSFFLLAGYGALTLFGGISLLLWAYALRRQVAIGEEKEWLVYLGGILLMSFFAGLGVWSVMAYALPAVAVLFARSTATADWRELAVVTGLATVATQRPWAVMTDPHYLAATSPHLSVARNIFFEPHALIGWVAAGIFLVWFISWVARGRRGPSLVAYGMGAAALMLLLGDFSGRIPVNRGFGYDGEHYARMIQKGFAEGTVSMQLRPVVLLINDEVNYQFFNDALATFQAMNVVYALALAIILADLCRRYGASPAATVTLIVNLFLCIAVAKMFAFYPVLIDLGAYAFMAASVWAIVVGRRLPIIVTTVLAVLSREFAVVNVLFGVVRDLRTGRSIFMVAATYAPAVAAFFWIRQFARRFVKAEDLSEPVLSIGALVSTLLQNTQWWSDPMYVMFWLYFAVTLFGGISLFLLTTHRPWWTCLRKEPEWLAFAVPIVAVTVVGYTDMWRYSAFLVPALPAFWAWGVSRVKPRRDLLLFAAVTLVTIATQRPWQYIDLEAYFRDWFPYYVVLEDRASAGTELWPVWTRYLATACVSFVGLGLVRVFTAQVRSDKKAQQLAIE
jgi:hypothetical protein